MKTTLLAFILFAFSAHADTLNDDQIINIMMTVDKGEISTSNEVLKKNVSSKVHQYAVFLIQQHQANLDQLDALAEKLKLQPKESTLSESIKKKGESDAEEMEDEDEDDLDTAYINAMVKDHQSGLDAIDNKLLPAAQNAQVKASLYKFRNMVYDHLQRGLALQKTLTPE